MNNSFLVKIASIVVITLLVGVGIGYMGKNTGAYILGNNSKEKERMALTHEMRDLWAHHVIWTREYIVAFAAGLAETQDTANRLLKNQEDIGNAFKPYYGEDTGNRLTSLLKEHITIATELIQAAKDDDQEKLGDADRRWKENAQQIAAMLSEMNPNWDTEELNNMLNEHLSLTTQEATAQLDGRGRDSIETFDKIFSQAIKMSDTFSQGIMKQFPDRF